jgi:hypothetical protein
MENTPTGCGSDLPTILRILKHCVHFSILGDFRKFSEYCSPGGQIVPTPRSSISHQSRASQLPYKNKTNGGGGGALLTGGGG